MTTARKLQCRVDRIVDHGGRVYTVDLVPASPVPRFRLGQFLHLTVDAYDPSGFWPESRVFSIASGPGDRSRVQICYSVKGRYTSRMEQELREGGDVWIKLPYGDFVIEDTGDIVLLAGGTGISAFTAFLESLAPADTRKVTLVYGARSPDLWLFRDMIERQLQLCASLSAIFFSESPISDLRPLTSDSRPPTSDLRLPTAGLRPPTSVFYLSGPPIMLSTLSRDLASRGVPPDRIRTDAWE